MRILCYAKIEMSRKNFIDVIARAGLSARGNPLVVIPCLTRNLSVNNSKILVL